MNTVSNIPTISTQHIPLYTLSGEYGECMWWCGCAPVGTESGSCVAGSSIQSIPYPYQHLVIMMNTVFMMSSHVMSSG